MLNDFSLLVTDYAKSSKDLLLKDFVAAGKEISTREHHKRAMSPMSGVQSWMKLGYRMGPVFSVPFSAFTLLVT